MKHETRRGIRVLISILHLAVQLMLMVFILFISGSRDKFETLGSEYAIFSALIYVGLMIGAFAVYYTFITLISRRNLPGD